MIKLILIFLCYTNLSTAVIYKLADEEYELMPPLVQVDSFESCMKETGGVYCSTHLTFVSDVESPLLNMMQEFSEHTTTHLNHTRALYGTCVTKKCKHFYKGKRKDLQLVLEACLNETFFREYKLKAITEDMYCCFEDDKQIKINSSHIIIAGLILTIVMLNIIGTLYDVHTDTKNHGIVGEFLLCFSIPENWRRLTAPAATVGDPKLRRLKAIHGMRAISMFLVILAHSFIPIAVLSSSAKFIELRYENIFDHIILNGTLIMQTFFIISAFLLTFNLELHSEKKSITWSAIPNLIIQRWLRLTPTYALVLGFTATWWRHLGSGPFWDKIVTVESAACEQYWLDHVLYINNYIDGSHCMPQTWYLAADTQLYTLGIIIYIICKNVKLRKTVLLTLFSIGVIIPSIHTFVQDLPGSLLISPNTANAYFVNDETFNSVYKRGHTNIAGYVMGISLGYLVHYMQKTNKDLSKFSVYRPLYWLTFPMALGIIISCKVFYADRPPFPLFLRVVVSALIRPVFAMLMAVILLGTIFKYDKLYRRSLEWSGWTTVSRASYSAFLVHTLYVRGLAGGEQAPFEPYYVRLIQFVVTCITFTYITGYVFWVTIESPLGQLAKMIFSGKKQEKNENNIEKQNGIEQIDYTNNNLEKKCI